jgi:hypothetical protein
MRFLTLPTLAILSGGLLLAVDSASVTYIDGNVADLAPNTGATLYLTNPGSMELKTSLHKVRITYSQISKAELGSVETHYAEAQPAYKVWALPKRLMKPETRTMTVAFTNESGQDQTITIEMSRAAAEGAFAVIERHNAKIADSNWWGDSYWKTNRNQDQWNGAGTVVAQK